MRSATLGILPLLLIGVTPVGAVCTQPVGGYVGGATEVDYFKGPVAVEGMSNFLISVTLKADKSGSVVVRSAVLGSTAVGTMTGTITAASHSLNKTTCLGAFAVTMGTRTTRFNYTSAVNGSILTLMFVPSSATDYGATIIRLERQ